MGAIEKLGSRTVAVLDGFGDFCRFCGRTFGWTFTGAGRRRTVSLIGEQMYLIGTKSVPVVMITGAFVGMVLAAQSFLQFKAAGLEARLGSIINISVVREFGPVLAGVMLAGRVGGALSAELGTMRVTEQIDALRAMGADPIRVLVMPRFIACTLLLPVLVLYADIMGILGGFLISTRVYDVNPEQFWSLAASTVEMFDILSGLIKSYLFGALIGLIGCYRGFRCEPGAAGVGRACTRSFVESTMCILGTDFFMGVLLNTIYLQLFGPPPVFV